MGTFNESDHPRKPKGVSGGGQFATKTTNPPATLSLTGPNTQGYPSYEYAPDILSYGFEGDSRVSERDSFAEAFTSEVEGTFYLSLEGHPCVVTTTRPQPRGNYTALPERFTAEIEVDPHTSVICEGDYRRGCGYTYYVVRDGGEPSAPFMCGGRYPTGDLSVPRGLPINEADRALALDVHHRLMGDMELPAPDLYEEPGLLDEPTPPLLHQRALDLAADPGNSENLSHYVDELVRSRYHSLSRGALWGHKQILEGGLFDEVEFSDTADDRRLEIWAGNNTIHLTYTPEGLTVQRNHEEWSLPPAHATQIEQTLREWTGQRLGWPLLEPRTL